jgi:thioredoxin reductase (NADPH)
MSKRVIIVGAGPAGLSAATYAASEGLNVTVIEAAHIGGQCRMSASIQNFLGFPKITGRALTARALKQAHNFGVNFIHNRVVAIDPISKTVKLACNTVLEYDALVLAIGLHFREMHFNADIKAFRHCIQYNPDIMRQHKTCVDKDVYIVGGANSAAQAALYLVNIAKSVTMLIRGDTLNAHMSQYLVNSIENSQICVQTNTEIIEIHGDTQLHELVIFDHKGNTTCRVQCDQLLLYIGQQPQTNWLSDVGIVMDNGYIVTNNYKTSVAGIFAIGDVVAGSVKRIGGAVGAGASVVAQLHEYLKTEE